MLPDGSVGMLRTTFPEGGGVFESDVLPPATMISCGPMFASGGILTFTLNFPSDPTGASPKLRVKSQSRNSTRTFCTAGNCTAGTLPLTITSDPTKAFVGDTFTKIVEDGARAAVFDVGGVGAALDDRRATPRKPRHRAGFFGRPIMDRRQR